MRGLRQIKFVVAKNWVFVGLVILIIGIYLRNNINLQTEIVAWPDANVTFSTNMDVLSQSWQPNVKMINGISIKCKAQSNFDAIIEMKIKRGEKILIEQSLECTFSKGEDITLNFSFGTLKVEPGVRHNIELRYLNVEEYGELNFDAGMEYGGCTIDGKDMDSALAYTIDFVKASRLWWMFVSFAPLFSFSFLLMIIWNRKFEETVAISLVILGIILYIAGFVEKLHLGISFVYIFASASFIIAIYLFNKNKLTYKTLLSPGLCIYTILIGFIIFNAYDLYMAKWDEYSHWGLAVKDMYYFSCFGKHVNSTLLLPRYFPFATLIEYWFVYHNGLFSENILYVGFHVMLLSALIPVTKSIRKSWKYLFPVLSVMILVPVTFFYDVSNCIYVDPLMAVWVSYILICYFDEGLSRFNWYRIIAGIFALVMTKDAGIVLAGCVFLIVVVDSLYKHFKEMRLKKIYWVGIMMWPILALVFFFSWQIYLSIPMQIIEENEVVVEEQSDGTVLVEDQEKKDDKEPVTFATISASGITTERILQIVNHEGYYDEVIKNFIIRMFDGDTYNLGNVGFSYMDLLIICVFLNGVFVVMICPNYKGRIAVCGGMVIVAGVMYAGFMLICYLFAFSKEEAIKLSSYSRYMSGYLAGVLIAGLSVLLIELAKSQEGQKVHRKLLIGICSILIIITPTRNFLIKNKYEAITPNKRHGYEEIQGLIRSIGEKGENIYFVCNDSNGEAYYMFRTAACPLKLPYLDWNIFSSEESYLMQCDIDEANGHQTIPGKYVTIEQLGDKLKQCQYLYLFHPNEVFAESYGDLFDEPEKIDDGTFYQVRVDETGEVKLFYVGQVGILSYE